MNELPVEIVDNIFQYLNHHDLWIIMPKVCKYFKQCVDYNVKTLTNSEIYIATALKYEHSELFERVCNIVMTQKKRWMICGCGCGGGIHHEFEDRIVGCSKCGSIWCDRCTSGMIICPICDSIICCDCGVYDNNRDTVICKNCEQRNDRAGYETA